MGADVDSIVPWLQRDDLSGEKLKGFVNRDLLGHEFASNFNLDGIGSRYGGS